MKNIFTPADILLPKAGADMERWAVVACDQFSSQPEYWDQLETYVGAEPSALRLMLPEAYLGRADAKALEENTNIMMDKYADENVWRTIENSYIFVERTLTNGRIRRGLVGKLDLEAYDWSAGSTSPVRSTEATVAERLPVRVAIRKKASVEMPHIMLLINDEADSVFGAIDRNMLTADDTMYDFDLYKGGGHIKGTRLSGEAAKKVQEALNNLTGDIIFAMGDGNHSLAAAKNYWEELKAAGAPMDHPARYALAEVVNLYDEAVEFFPIHRVLFGTDEGGFIKEMKGEDTGALVSETDAFCKEYLASHGGSVDYIHGTEEAIAMGKKPGCAALLLPSLPKSELFPHVERLGNYPKKSFSIGHSLDKRWYLECRKIK